MKTIMNFFLTLIFVSACGIEIHEDSSANNDGPEMHQTDPYVYTGEFDDDENEYDPCEGYEPTIRYSVKRNSRLDTHEYQRGERLSGSLYMGAYDIGKSPCPRDHDTSELYENDVKNTWVEITSFAPYNPSFVKSYFVPSESVSFHDTSEELGIIVDLDFVVLDQDYQDGTSYLIRVFVENKSGLVTSARTWANDLEAFESLGFEIPSETADTTPIQGDENFSGDESSTEEPSETET